MSHLKSDDWHVQHTHNTARFFTENRHISWVALAATFLAGYLGYTSMPQRKDPDIPIRVALVICPWPAVETEKVEQLVTRRIEEVVAENTRVKRIESTTRVGVSFVYITMHENFPDVGKEFDDIKLRLDGIRDLPDGAGPITFVKDFGSTAALMLTVASPPAGEVQISILARELREAVARVRARPPALAPEAPGRLVVAYCFPPSLNAQEVRRPFQLFINQVTAEGKIRDPRYFEGAGFVGVDCASDLDNAQI